MSSRGKPWEDDPELRAQEAAERRKAQGRKPNGLDRERRIKVVPFEKMVPRLSGLSLIQGLLGLEQTSVIYGDFGCGKTFLALDMGLHIATGDDWLGHRVEQRSVVYIAAEAGRMIYNRVFAWRIDNKLISDKAARRVDFFAVPMQIDLCHDDGDRDKLIEAIREHTEYDPSFVVIDTLARVMAGGNENSSEDMGAVIASADRLRDEFGCHVAIIHHIGKDASRGARGHSSLLAAVDTAIEVTRDEDAKISTAKVVKQRDGEAGERIHFTLRVVKVGENEHDEDVTSCVVEAADEVLVARAGVRRPKEKLSDAQRTALKALEAAIQEKGVKPPADAGISDHVHCVRIDEWRAYSYQHGISTGDDRARRLAFQRASAALISAGKVTMSEPWVWIGA